MKTSNHNNNKSRIAMIFMVILGISCIGHVSSGLVKSKRVAKEDCPTICPGDYKPVCGSDGKTYPNACALKTITCKNPSIKLTREEPCEGAAVCDELCAQKVDRVCGSDGLTYDNECFMRVSNCHAGKKGVFKAYDGECRGKRDTDNTAIACPTVCPLHHAPVCGSNRVTYPNECALQAAACKDNTISLASKGKCDQSGGSVSPADDCNTKFCTEQYDPECGSDGKTYGNPCMLQLAACKDKTLKTDHKGECESTDKFCETAHQIPCPLLFGPICGSDGKSYDNACYLKVAACKDPSLKKVHDGQCESGTEAEGRGWCKNNCSSLDEPVCGSDGITYSNTCILKLESCRTGIAIRALFLGNCGSSEKSCDKVCPINYEPICGSDGTTYSNECQLEVHNCQRSKDSGGSAPEITREHLGGC